MRTYYDIVVDFDEAQEMYPELRINKLCVGVAWAAITGDDLVTSCHVLQEITGDVPGKICWDELLRSFDYMGYRIEEHTPHARTVRTLGRGLKDNPDSWLVSCKSYGHAFAIVDGLVVDWGIDRLYHINKLWKVSK